MDNEVSLPVCPFYVKDSREKMWCEGGTIKLPDREARHEIVMEYCSNMRNYKNCTICRMLMNYYDRKEQ